MIFINESQFLDNAEGNTFRLITLQNKNGLCAQFTNYGARWVSMWVPDKEGISENILLGFDKLSGYKKAGEQYHGAVVGRVCGRIGNAAFNLNGKTYRLASNDVYGKPVKNHLHGGIQAFHNRVWDIRSVNREKEESVTFSLFSMDGEEGYPGNLRVYVTYTLTDGDALRMECYALTDKPTPVNLTNHAFFNLAGKQSLKSILDHTLTLCASSVIECDEELLPTGKLLPVEGRFYDFRNSRTLAQSLALADENTRKDNGFSLAFVWDTPRELSVPMAILEDRVSGRRLELCSNQPSLQVYTGYFMDGTDIGPGDIPYFANAGLALEPQGFPDAPNHPEFPSVIIDKDKPYRHVTEYRFSVN